MTQPATIVEGSKQVGNKMFPSIAVILQRRDTALKLKEHVKANDHHLLEVRVCNLVIKEVLCNEFTQTLLESGLS